MTTKEIKAIECKFVIHVPTRTPEKPDIHFVKELIQYTDDTYSSNFRTIKDYKRPYWITNPKYRNHHEKKEWEDIDKLGKFTCTQSSLRYDVATALGTPWSKDSIKALSRSPYLYGSDISSSALIKSQYETKYNNVKFASTVAVYDIETDVEFGTGVIIIGTIIFKNKILTVATKLFMQNFTTPELFVDRAFNKYLGEYKDKLNLEYEFRVVNSPVEVVKAIFKQAHIWQPDFLAIWNMDFDIPRTLKAIEDAGMDPKDIMCDPRIPKEFRRCEYKEGRKKKVTASGKITPITPSSQWHTLYCTSSFYVIDAMAVYKRIRTPPNPEEPSYSLEAILNKELNIGKLKFTEADAYRGLKWHQVMQTKYKAEYIVYNMFDCLSMLELDLKTKDLSHTFLTYAGITEFEKYTSNPKKIHDELHGFCLENNLVISASGSTPQGEVTEELINILEDDESEEEEIAALETLSLAGWIITLPAHLTEDNGLQVIEENPTLKTNMRGFVFDSDATAAYPSATIACNVSKSTTKCELSVIEGIDPYVFKMQNINLVSSGNINALEYCTEMFNFPTLDVLLEEFKKII
jgi:hypothetical protein